MGASTGSWVSRQRSKRTRKGRTGTKSEDSSAAYSGSRKKSPIRATFPAKVAAGIGVG
jgi:hypothetical protein